MSEVKFSYNRAMEELENILDSLENGKPDVDEMSKKVKRAVELISKCRKKLTQTDKEIQAVFDEFNSSNQE